MKRLNEFINCPYEDMIYNIKSDSRDVKPGDLFVAVKGFNVDHTEYIYDAIEKGAVAVVTEQKMDLDVPVIVVSDVNKAFYEICRDFYDQDKWHFDLIGVTGTDGKTTTATIIQNILNKFQDSAYIGTNGLIFQDINHPVANTTPLTEFLYQYLQELNEKKCKYVSLEVSSEALLHRRVDELRFRYAILTNISEDHLNIHKTIENYIQAKSKLFTLIEKGGYAILNVDDKHAQKIQCEVTENIVTYGINNKADFKIKNINCSTNGSSFDIMYNQETYHIESPFIGVYNIYNLTAAFIVCYLEKYDIEKVISNIAKLAMIPGRGEFLDFGQEYSIVLDYAHTTNGIKNILDSLQRLKSNRIITVIGSAGGREKEKRGLMGKEALEKSDLVIFTMDDPRCEKVSDIIDDLVSISKNDNYLRIENREEAIAKAFDMAESGDIVAILGKGRDNYMAIGTKKITYCDYNVIEKYFQDKKFK